MPGKKLEKSSYDIVSSSNLPLTIALFVLFVNLGLASFQLGLNKFFTSQAAEVLQETPSSYPTVRDGCVVGGCSGEICAEEPMVSICIWREEYACYRQSFAICERQSDGRCRWQPNDELLNCLKCTEEGERMPVYLGNRCCPGLESISPAQPDASGNCPTYPLGVSICAKCGNGVCGSGENKCNCPQDCPYRAKEGEMCGGFAGIMCQEDLECIYEDGGLFAPYPDASGVCRQIKPHCSAVGSKSEGWYSNGGLIKYDNCQGCQAQCLAVGTRSEGWYSSCNQSLIEYALCRPGNCPPVICTLYCQYGFKTNENSCPICECRVEPWSFPKCALEGEIFSTVYSEYPDHCCQGLTEWMSGMDTRKVENGVCVETGLLGGAPIGHCLNCGDGYCETIENICNCPQDCGDDCQYDYDNSRSIGIGDMLHVLNNWDSSGITKLLGVLGGWGRGCPES